MSESLPQNSIATAPAHLSAAQFRQEVLSSHPRTAVFDCDGTLWKPDAGYGFMVWSIETGLVARDRALAMDERYRLYRCGQISEVEICGNMVQLYTDLRDSELRRAAADFFGKQVRPGIFPEMEQLVAELRATGCDVWAVSSTNHWVIEEALRPMHIAPDHILCARARVEGDRITSDLIDVPTGEGKAASLRHAGLLTPDAVFGNSIHDAAMLGIARRPFVVNPTSALLELAGDRHWPVFFPPAVMRP